MTSIRHQEDEYASMQVCKYASMQVCTDRSAATLSMVRRMRG
jgi:hypothetical protein